MTSSSESLVKNWFYRGEGNRSLVIANSMERIVYRIIKTSSDNISLDELKSLREDVKRTIDFVNDVMCQMVGPVYLTPMTLVTISNEFVRAVKDIVHPHRPVYRLHKDLNADISLAIQLPDLCCSLSEEGGHGLASQNPTISVEIKPKWGFMPGPDTSVMSIKRNHCRFCMHQIGKDCSDRYKQRSEYCPIDFFSGCPARIKSSLRRLLKSPQNNLCLFSDGNAVWKEGVKKDLPPEVLDSLTVQSIDSTTKTSDLSQAAAIDNLLDLVTRCLLRDCSTTSSSSSSSSSFNSRISPLTYHEPQICEIGRVNSGHACDHDCPVLPPGSILERILSAQKLDELDIEGLKPHHETLHKHFKLNPAARDLLAVDGPFSNDWLSQDCDKSFQHLSFSLLKVKQFLLSRSAKDCSIFVSVQRYNSTSTNLPDNVFLMTDSYGHRFICRVSVIDLDPKSFDRIPFYVEEDEKVVAKFLKKSQPGISSEIPPVSVSNRL